MTARCSPPSWPGSGSTGPVQADRGPVQTGCWRTRATPAARSAAISGGAAFPATIPERKDQQANRQRRGQAGGRPPAFDPSIYKRRNIVERCFNQLKQHRAIATRYDKTAQSYQAMIDLATLLIWL